MNFAIWHTHDPNASIYSGGPLLQIDAMLATWSMCEWATVFFFFFNICQFLCVVCSFSLSAGRLAFAESSSAGFLSKQAAANLILPGTKTLIFNSFRNHLVQYSQRVSRQHTESHVLYGLWQGCCPALIVWWSAQYSRFYFSASKSLALWTNTFELVN